MSTPERDEEASGFWSGVGDAVATVGRVVGSGASAVGRSVAGAYLAVDPDLRRQIFQAPLLGLMSIAPRSTPGVEASHERDVLLIHGLGGHPCHFMAMRRYFAHVAGRQTHCADLCRADCLDEMARRLRARIQELCERRRGDRPEKIDIIAHSMGGIVARLALEEAETRQRVATLVTMATPHGGTHLARLAATPRTLDLRPRSPVIERLQNQDFWDEPRGPRLVALWSESDTAILPPTSAAWEAAQTHQLPEFTHLSYLVSPASWRFLVRLLRTPVPMVCSHTRDENMISGR